MDFLYEKRKKSTGIENNLANSPNTDLTKILRCQKYNATKYVMNTLSVHFCA